ncbi:Pfs domain protein [Aspergillus clavatus NRRL 1]|uniref:Pfs domain protein n=1 Tax=Aspergillus clavatus (strain ATCC 1007 / CBS 513.65 / DSM 816 / NCTC 3887 / NRRL 1 / QM 1276 / 107) TaxID=344612 RepID=A1CLN7_ASPCL|nr:Pfs domain protein [Aspergillus clavatus NRRL 1]EAW09016.1 Pfs domain protein [Aspergillus clavatus NRRL 1]
MPLLEEFAVSIMLQNPGLEPALADRFAKEQVYRFKRLTKAAIDHAEAVINKTCSAGRLCFAQGGEAVMLASSNGLHESEGVLTQSQTTRHGALVTPAQFPLDVPMPPVKGLPAEFECPICFKVKRFYNPSHWTEHVYEDIQPFTCTFPDCSNIKTFKRKVDWIRHENEWHRKLEWWLCPFPDCHHTCYRKDNFVQHLVREHKVRSPKRKVPNIEDGGSISPQDPFAPDAQDQNIHEEESKRLWELVEKCHCETQRASDEEPCRFCGKICASWGKLSDHLADHLVQLALLVLALLKENSELEIGLTNQQEHPSSDSNKDPNIYHNQGYLNLDQRHLQFGIDSRLGLNALEKWPHFPDSSHESALVHHTPPSFTTGTVADSGYASTKHERSRKARSQAFASPLGVSNGQFTLSHDPLAPSASDDVNSENSKATESIELGSIYSEISGVSADRKEIFISELAEELANVIQPYQPSEDARQRISQLLPELLRGFAFRFGRNASSQMHRDVMVFIHKHRRDVTTSLIERFSETYGANTDGRYGEKMPLLELMALWDSKVDTDVDRIPDECREAPDENEGNEEDDANYMDENYNIAESADLIAYKKAILNAPAFQTLAASLQRECLLVSPDQNTMQEISQRLLDGLQQNPRISRRKSADTFKAKCTPAEALKTAITLTGSSRAAQAATCGRYLSQAWPSTGQQMIDLVKALVQSGLGVPRSDVLLDGTEMIGELQLSSGGSSKLLYVEVLGTAHSIVDTIQLLAWLGAALRVSPIETGVAYCRPIVQGNWILEDGSQTGWAAELLCKIEYTIRAEYGYPALANGQCWHHLFRNPVIVEGYPILRRPDFAADAGLEIPLNMMAGLAQAYRISTFNGRTLLKGWSTMLVPTKQDNDMVLWHLIYHPNGDRISYQDCETFLPIDTCIPELEKVRHVLGWCSEMRFFGGAADASYNVRPSRLPATSKGCMLDQVHISSGHTISGGHPFSIGYKDIPLHISRHGYIRKLKWIAQRFVLLWDEGDKRGWLVKGTSALLHLVRAAMDQASADDFKSYLLFSPDQLQESRHRHKPAAAIDVLMDPRNRALKVYQEKDDYIRFENQVERFYDLLEKIIDHQQDAVENSRRQGTTVPRAYLEGWDFHELAAEVDPVRARVAILDSIGKSWVDFTRSLNAVTLCGRGFGDIIKPTEGCSQWARLPKGRYYLAACMSDLKSIMDKQGDPDSIPMKLVDDILWYNNDSSFVPCRCNGEDDQPHSDFAQVLLPSTMARDMLQDMSRAADLNNGGAVIFGQNRNRRWFWGDTGEPSRKAQEVKPPDEGSLSPSYDDSGIGQSVRSSTAKVGASMVSGPQQCPLDESSAATHSGSISSRNTGALSITSLHERIRETVPEDYKVGILCALYLELMAVRALFDSKHEALTITDNDPNYYALGQIGPHNVVAACLPDGGYGTNSATRVASNMKRTFPEIKFCLLVGIGGGAPSTENDVRLGDVVVSRPSGTSGGVLNYELGKAIGKGVFQLHGCLPPAPEQLMCAISDLRSDPKLPSTPLQPYLDEIASWNPEYQHPGAENDRLFASDYIHSTQSRDCKTCDARWEVNRSQRLSTHPKIHYGLIASGNKVVRDAGMRDSLAKEYNVFCFEMEAAGVLLTFPCLVIRGICDYADSHKNKKWQEYAAAAAAAYAKLLLSRVRATLGQSEVRDTIAARSASECRPSKRMRTGSSGDMQRSWGLKRNQISR